MSSRKQSARVEVDFSTPAADIQPVRIEDEVSDSFLEYAYHVIGGRALPDARDGLKPVHRRILFEMNDMGLLPSHAYVKVARIVGSTMGRLHPHGDSAISDALVRMGQDFSMSVPFVDGHGNFGSLDSGPAAARYIEARLSPAALNMVASVAEDTVDMVPNYDGSLLEPSVLPAAFPNLLVNGAEGIAVGMATKMAPHNLGEAVAAARLLLAKPKSTLDELMAVLPGPDFPGGCTVITGDGAREAYETGKGTVTMRAVARIQPLEGSRGRNEIVVTALPYMVGPEKVVEAIRKGVSDRKIVFVSDVIDLSESDMDLRIELKSGVNPEQALASLYALTPMEQNFSISSLALVDGQPRTLSLVDLLTVFLEFRKEVVLRRSEFRRGKAEARLHLVEGLVRALDAIDLVVKTIRAAKTTVDARSALMKHRSLAFSEAQASHILEMPLRRLTALESDALRKEQKALQATIKDLSDIIENPRRLVKVIDGELAEIAASAPARGSQLVAAAPLVAALPSPADGVTASDNAVIDDTERTWHLTRTGALKTTCDLKKDVVVSSATVTGHMMLFCADGVAVKVPAALTDGIDARTLAGRGVPVVGVAPTDRVLIAGTKRGIVKTIRPEWPVRGDEAGYMALAEDDMVLWVGVLDDDVDAVFVTSDAQLLRFPAVAVRPQGRSGGGMAGIRLADGADVIAFTAVNAGAADLFTMTDGGRQKVTALSEYPQKGRGTGGVRCHSMTKGSTCLAGAAIVAAGGVVPDMKSGKGVKAPERQKRDGSGI